MKTVVIIWFACSQSNEKSGTNAGTGSLSVLSDDAISFPQARVIAQIPENRAAVIPPSLSRTPVPNFDRGNRCLYWMSRSPEDCTNRQRFCTRTGNAPPGPRTTGPVSGGNRNGGSRIRGERRIAPKARVAPRVRSGGEDVRQRTKGRSEGGKTPVFLPDSG